MEEAVVTSGEKKRASIPWGAIITSLIASLFLCAGVAGLLMPELVPKLARPAVAWSLIGVGIVLDLGAIFHFVSARIQDR